MKQSILPLPAETLKKRLNLYTALCISAAVMTAGLNLLLALTFTPQTRTPFLLVNIAADIVCGALLVFFFETRILPGKRLLRLAAQEGVPFSGRVERVSGNSIRYLNMDCREVLADGRRLFLPKGTIVLKNGEAYRFRTVSNVITEAEQ